MENYHLGKPIGKIIHGIRKMLARYEGDTALQGVAEESSSDPFQVLIATILSHRTRDENTEKAASQLFSVYPTPQLLANADEQKIQELIKPSGFYRVKSRRVKEVARLIMEKYDGRVPSTLEELLELPAVGRKTANCVLVYGFKEPAIPVDTHVHRISNRLGLVHTKTPEKTEEELRKKIHKRYWLAINELFVRLGQKVCRPIGPKCQICNLTGLCSWYHANRMGKVKAHRTKRPSS